MDNTEITLLMVSIALFAVLARMAYVAYVTSRAEKFRGEYITKKVAADLAQESYNQQQRQFKRVVDSMDVINQRQERINQAQEKLIADLSSQVNRLLAQEKAVSDRNIRLQEENEKLSESHH
jgi:Tfp pilus assembly protein PilE